MIRLHRHPVVLSLLCGAALLGTNCGGGDDDSAASSGASGGKAGSGFGGKGGTAGKAGASGSSGESGATGEGGAGATTSSGGSGGKGGKGGKGGGNSTGGSSSPGGAGGDAGAASESIALTPADSSTQLIEADVGGTVTLGTLTLVIPPDALAEDTEITIRSFEETGALFVFEPDGLEFATPITARFTLPASKLEDPATEGVLPIFTLETGALGEPMELVESTSVELDDDDNYVAEGELSHFSAALPRFVALPVARRDFVHVEDLMLAPAMIPVGVQFTAVASVTLASLKTPFDVAALASGDPKELHLAVPVHLIPAGVAADATLASGLDAVKRVPDEFRYPLPGAPIELEEDETLMISRQFRCSYPGDGYALMAVQVTASFDATSSGYAVRQDDQGNFWFDPGLSGSRRIEMRSAVRTTSAVVTCLEKPSVLTALGLTGSTLDDSAARFKAAWQDDCYWLSNHGSCKPPDPARAVVNVLDPVLQVGPDAAARLEAAFPCGDGPVGKTSCGTPGTFAEGDYVFVLATFGDDIPLDDDTSLFQHAFVFDADGISGNNYVPPSAYPDDFFAGTDKWYQLLYTPAAGFSLKVVDARISSSNPVASNARMVVAGRELAAFIPRAELDGTDPGFRVSTFRHEGDYGLDGGPWDASYYPPLDEPLMPAAGGDVIVLPED